MKYKNKNAKVDKYTLREIRRQKRENALKGEGEYRFVNNTRGDLTLSKPPIEGPNPVPAGRTFVGDSYFLILMKTGDVRLVEVIKAPSIERKETMSEQKLILDQPSRFTNQGQTEHVALDNKAKSLNENQPQAKTPNEKLITEDPLEGVEILLG
jgi:hypothetical protein